jgi:uncharacterized membrane protein
MEVEFLDEFVEDEGPRAPGFTVGLPLLSMRMRIAFLLMVIGFMLTILVVVFGLVMVTFICGPRSDDINSLCAFPITNK